MISGVVEHFTDQPSTLSDVFVDDSRWDNLKRFLIIKTNESFFTFYDLFTILFKWSKLTLAPKFEKTNLTYLQGFK